MNILLSANEQVILIIILLVLVGLLLVGSFMLIYFFGIRRARQKKQIRELDRRYKLSHDSLVGDIEHTIERLEKISSKNEDYVESYNSFRKEANKILTEKDKNAYVAIKILFDHLQEKKYKELNNLINGTKLTLSQFEKATNELNRQLMDFMTKDEDFRQSMTKVQRKYRELKAIYEEHSIEVKSIENSFEKFFNKLEVMIKESENLAESAHYEEANEALPKIDQVLDAMILAFRDIPTLCFRISNIIPKRIEEVKERFEELEKKEFPLHHLKVNLKIDIFNDKLDELQKLLAKFDTFGIKEQLDEIDNEILEIFREFDDEEKAKAYFDENSQAMYDETYELEKLYTKINRQLPNYSEIYKLKEKYIDKINNLAKDIDNVAQIKGELDNYMHSSTKQPYSYVLKKMQDMSKDMEGIKQTVKDINNYLGSLKNNTEDIYKNICELFISLKDRQYLVREMHVPAYSDRVRFIFDRLYQELEAIGNIIKIRPIDVEKANEQLTEVEEQIENLFKDVDENVNVRGMAEEAIVYANHYRQGFVDYKFILETANKSFYEADFSRAMDGAMGILKKMRPDNK